MNCEEIGCDREAAARVSLMHRAAKAYCGTCAAKLLERAERIGMPAEAKPLDWQEEPQLAATHDANGIPW